MKKLSSGHQVNERERLQIGRGFPYNPKVFRNNAIPGRRFPGAPEAENSGSEFERGEIGMNATQRLTGLAILGALCLIFGTGRALSRKRPQRVRTQGRQIHDGGIQRLPGVRRRESFPQR